MLFALFFGLQFGIGIKILVWLRLSRPADAALENVVRGCAAERGVPLRRVRVLRSLDANAMARVVLRDIAFTDRLVAAAREDELRGICVHELAHLQESRWIVAVRMARALIWSPLIFVRPIHEAYGGAGIAALGFALFLAWFWFLRLSQTLERRADKAGIGVSDGLTYARALCRLHERNFVPACSQRK